MENFKNIVDNARERYIVVDDNKKILYGNESALDLWNFESDEFLTHNIDDLFLNIEIEQIIHNDSLKSTNNDVSCSMEARAVTKEKNHIPIEIKSCSIEWSGKKASLLVIREIIERKWMERVFNIGQKLSTEMKKEKSFEKKLEMCLHSAIKAAKMDCGGIYLLDEKEKKLELISYKGLPDDFIQVAGDYNINSENFQLIREGKPIFTNYKKFKISNAEKGRKEGLKILAILPFKFNNKIMGCLNVASHTLDQFPKYSQKVLEFISTYTGMAIINTKRREKNT
jgi:PAS domain S-box-containing protein